jgi:hypothetical protein
MDNPQPAAKPKAKPARKADANPIVDLIDVAQDLFALAEDASSQANPQQEYMKVYERRSEFMTEEMTGFVWVYLQK